MPLLEQFSARIGAIADPHQFVTEGARAAVEAAGVDWEDVTGLIVEFEARASAHLRTFDYAKLPDELAWLRRALAGVGPKPRNELDEIAAREGIHTRGKAAGWNSLEVDFAMAALQGGETLTAFSRDGVTTSTGRTLSRSSLRAANRPPSWTRDDTWSAQFPKLAEESQS